MDILDRLLGHDRWTTSRLLELSQPLTDEQLDRPFDIGHRTLRATFDHMIGNVEVWTDLIAEIPVDRSPTRISIPALIERHERAYGRFTDLACAMRDADRLNATFIDTLDRPPTAKPIGGAIVHLITHNMHHRSEVLHILTRLGVTDLPEGDALSWEQQACR